jgi:hypothetical protein
MRAKTYPGMSQKSGLDLRVEVVVADESNEFSPAPNTRSEGASDSAWFPLTLAALFLLFQFFNILHHPMWRDELQPWMIARHSHSIAELVFHKRYEGHPDGWFALLYMLTRFTSHPFWMQISHICIASVTTYVIARFSPFTQLERILIVFGYFLFFEYAAISREYALGVLGIFCFCAMFTPGPRKSYLLLAVALAVMCESSVYGVILAAAFILAIALEAVLTPHWSRSVAGISWQMSLSTGIACSSIGLALLHMCPPSDSGVETRTYASLNGLSDTFGMLWMSFVPIPQLTRTFWNTNTLQVPGVLYRLMAILSIAVLCISILFFVRKRIICAAYVFGVGCLLLFKQFVFRGYMRHDGFAFVLFLACLWLASAMPEQPIPIPRLERMASGFAPLKQKILLGCLAIQALVGVTAACALLKIPFSQAKATAEFIQSKKMNGWTIIGDKDAPVSSVAGYLDREIYYLMGDRPGTFIVWDQK